MKRKQRVTLSTQEHAALEYGLRNLLNSKAIDLDSANALLKKLQDADKIYCFRSSKPWD